MTEEEVASIHPAAGRSIPIPDLLLIDDHYTAMLQHCFWQSVMHEEKLLCAASFLPCLPYKGEFALVSMRRLETGSRPNL